MGSKPGNVNRSWGTLFALLFTLACIQAADAQGFNPQANQNSGAINATAGNTEDLDAALRQQIDILVQTRMQEQSIPGYSLSVVKDGRIILHNSYGLANIDQRRPTTNETVFGLASVTKTFTAFCLLSLVDKGLVGLDDPLDKYLNGLGDQYKKLTIRQLASMAAGVPSNIGEQRPWTQQYEQLVHTPLLSEPGSKYLYSNYSYRLLGSVIESVTGKPYLEVVRETMLIPFGMNSTGTTVTLGQTGLVAQTYGDNNGAGPLRAIPFRDPAAQFSAGMLESSSDDMLKYALALMRREILSPTAYQTLWYERPPLTTGEPSKWAFGWGSKISPIYGGARTVSMNGGVPGVASSMILLPERNSCVVALCNLRKPPVYKIATEVAILVFGSKNGQPAEPEAEGSSMEASDD
jgi:CubicO group peptidase (beta-lactamase class C family)